MKTMTDLLGNTFTYDKTIKYAILNKINDKTLDVSKMYHMTQLSYMSSNSIRDYTAEVMIMEHFEKFVNGGSGSKRECIKSMAKVLQYFFDNSISKDVNSDTEVLSSTDVKGILTDTINDALYSIDMLLTHKYDILSKGIIKLYKTMSPRKLETNTLHAGDSVNDGIANADYEASITFGTMMTDAIILRQVLIAVVNDSVADEDYNSHWFNHRAVSVLEKLDNKLNDEVFALINTLDLSSVNRYM